MTRVEFTKNICSLISEMIAEGEQPILDYVKRSDEEQMHLYQEGKSKCDGIKIRSRHQSGLAADIYFVEGGKLVMPKAGYGYWHEVWEKKGGKPEITWDRGHFE